MFSGDLFKFEIAVGTKSFIFSDKVFSLALDLLRPRFQFFQESCYVGVWGGGPIFQEPGKAPALVRHLACLIHWFGIGFNLKLQF